MVDKKWVNATGVDGLTFAERLTDLLSAKEVKPNTLAKETNIGQSTISNLMNPKEENPRIPGSDIIRELAKYFGVSSDYLLGFTDVKSNNELVQAACAATHLDQCSIDRLMIPGLPGLAEMTDDFILSAWESNALTDYLCLISEAKKLAEANDRKQKITLDEVASEWALMDEAAKHRKTLVETADYIRFCAHSIGSALESYLVKKYIQAKEE